jgi:hypothetical protein
MFQYIRCTSVYSIDVCIMSHVIRNPPNSMGRLFSVVTNLFPAAAAACHRDWLHVKLDNLYLNQGTVRQAYGHAAS